VLRAHRLQRVVPLGGLSAQHDAVGAVQHGVGHVAALGPGGAGLLDHALQHLRGIQAMRSRGDVHTETSEDYRPPGGNEIAAEIQKRVVCRRLT